MEQNLPKSCYWPSLLWEAQRKYYQSSEPHDPPDIRKSFPTPEQARKGPFPKRNRKRKPTRTSTMRLYMWPHLRGVGTHKKGNCGSYWVESLKPNIPVPCLKPPKGRTLMPDPWAILVSNQKTSAYQHLFRLRNGHRNGLYPLKPNSSSNNSYLFLKVKNNFKNGFLIPYSLSVDL